MAEFLTAGKENTVEVMFVLPQKHSQLLISDGFSACQMGQVSKFIDMKVHSNVGNYLKPFEIALIGGVYLGCFFIKVLIVDLSAIFNLKVV